MLKIASYIIAAVLITGLAYQNWMLQQQQKESAAQIADLNRALSKEKNLEQQLHNQLNQRQDELLRQKQVRQSELDEMFRALSAERTKLVEIQQRLQNIKSKGFQSNEALQAQIQRDQERLKTLNNRLRDYKGAEKEASSQGVQNLKSTNAQAKAVNAEINQQFKIQQGLVKETAKQIAFWQKRTHDINQHDKLEELNKQKEEQEQVLAQLQNDRANSNFSDNQKSRQIKAEMALEQQDLQATEGQIRQQIHETENDLKKLKSEGGKAEALKKAYENDLHNTQSEADQQSLKVRNMTQDYERKLSDFQKFQSSANGL